MRSRSTCTWVALFVVTGLLVPAVVGAQAGGEEPWLADRGTGIRTSIFGTYVRPHELLVSPFFEYYYDNDHEYKPSELGHGLEQDFLGEFRASEWLIFLGYGLTDWLAIELEAAVIDATLRKAPDDPSRMPESYRESGQGDWQVQLDWRMFRETATRPEIFSFFEVVPPSNKDALLIGTSEWEYKLGGGLIRGFGWGTLTARAAVEYLEGEGTTQAGEYAVEYLKRLSRSWRVYAGIEGVQDEVEAIGEAQWHLSDRVYIRLNSAFGLTPKAVDWAPDVGIVWAFPVGG